MKAPTDVSQTTARKIEQKLFKDAKERIQRESHHMARDVPYWVEDFLEVGVGVLTAVRQGAWFSLRIALLTASLYEIYAVLNDLPLLSFHDATQMGLSLAVFGGMAWLIAWAFRGRNRVGGNAR